MRVFLMVPMFLSMFLLGCGTHQHLSPYQVQLNKHDTLEAIAYTYNIPLNTLIKLNKLEKTKNIKAGTVLNLPIPTYKEEQEIEQEQEIKQPQIQEGPLFGPDAINKVNETVLTKADEKEVIKNEKIEVVKTQEIKTQMPKMDVIKPEQQPKTEQMPIVQTSSKRFGSPLKQIHRCDFNPRTKIYNLVPEADKNAYAISDGEMFVSDQKYASMGGGQMAVVKHNINGQTYISVYGGLGNVDKSIKQIKKGEKIGSVINPAGLHFELRKGSVPVDATNLVDGV